MTSKAKTTLALAILLAFPLVHAADDKAKTLAQEKEELSKEPDLPMSKEVASGQALSQTQDGYSEAIKNVAGLVSTNSAGTSNDAFAIRGIKLNLFSNYRLDGGLPITGVITNPIENKERVETLKGANALMFGIASPAGIINFVPKRAGMQDVTTVSLAGNSFGQYGAGVDIGRRMGPSKQFGLRFNASATHLENGVRNMDGEGQFASLGMDLQATSRLELQADIEYYRRRVPEQAGLSLLKAGADGSIPIPTVPNPRNLLSGRWDMYTPETTNAQVRADYHLSDDWKVLVQAGYSGSHRHRTTVRIGSYDPNTGANGIVSIQPVTNEYRNNFARAELRGHFDTWTVDHDLTMGVSRTTRYALSKDVQNITLPQHQNFLDPIELAAPVYTKPGVANPGQTSTDEGLYAYDTISLTHRLKMLLGVRAVKDTEIGSKTSTSHVTSPAYGFLFDVQPTTTLFASYMEGLEAGGTAPANAANANVILAPTVSKQKEVGIRDASIRGLSVNVSYFDIVRGNAVTDPVSNIFGYSGDLSYKGVEATMAYDITRQWRVTGGVLRLRARQDSPTQPLINGRVPENTPDWNGNVGVAYRVDSVRGLTLKGGIKSISRRPVNAQNQGYIPGYSLFDAGFNYATRISGHKASFQATVDNLGNKRYWNSITTGTYGIGMDRSVKFSAKFDF